jgi:hypothetical protein
MSLPDLSDPFRFGSTDRDRMPRLNEDLTGKMARRNKRRLFSKPNLKTHLMNNLQNNIIFFSNIGKFISPLSLQKRHIVA